MVKKPKKAKPKRRTKKPTSKKKISKLKGKAKPVKKKKTKWKSKAANRTQKEKNALLKAKSFMRIQASADIPTEPISKEAIEKLKQYVKPRGRPPRYRKAMCQQLISLMSEGMSFESAAIQMGIYPGAMWGWQKKHKELKAAIKIGRKLCKEWWMRSGRENMHSRNFNHILWMMNMSNRFKWLTSSSKQEVKKKSKTTIEVKVERSDERAARVLQILAGSGAIESGIKKDQPAKGKQVHSMAANN